MIETWLPIPGYEGFYEVSDHGHVRGVDRVIPPSGPRGAYMQRGQAIRGTLDRDGYARVCLWRHGIRGNHHAAHLVLETFVGSRPDGMQCCHYDDVPTNNHVSNLRWDYPVANTADLIRNGRHYGKQVLQNKSHCPRNHPYDEANTYVAPSGKGGRRCRMCQYEANRARRLAKNLQVAS